MGEVFKLAPHDWARLRALLDEALALPVHERAAWLRALPEARAGALRSRLESLLAAAADAAPATAARLLETLPKVETAQFAPAPGSGEKAGDSIGPYRLVRELGSGGMGSVWLAERTDMLQGRQVALKLPHGAWKRAGLAERLAREREILATLEHPHIARLYDAGVTPEGRPWLALEFVAGERIDGYCRSRRLPVPARLALFLQVARAVAHAHAQLVVHRDLKPANILVTDSAGAADVKLLDFGIAKLVAEGVVEETELTREVGRAFTPEYASPEQILDRPLGTASDVYSLGVVLFELLAEVRPYQLQRSSRAALEEAVATADVPRPSALAPRECRNAIRGDLDTIVLKALKREPSERYATVAALAEDIQRHLEQRPVLARPDGAWYRVQRFVRRHRVAVAGGAVVSLALVGGAAVALWQAGVARAEQQRAEQVAAFIGAVFNEANPFQQGGGKALSGVELLRLAKDRLLAAPPSDVATRVDLLTLLGTSLLALEDLPTAADVLQRAEQDAAGALGPADARTRRATLRRADVLRLQEKNDEARALVEPLLPVLRARAGAFPEDLSGALWAMGELSFKLGRPEAVEAFAREGLAHVQARLGAVHPERLRLLGLQVRANRVQGRSAEALAASEDALRLAQALYAGVQRHPQLSETRYLHAFVLADNGRYREAVAAFRIAIAETEALFGRASRRYGTRLGAASEIFAEAGLLREAIDGAERARETLRAHAPPKSRLDVAVTEGVALAHNWARHGAAALPHWQYAEAGYVALFGETHWTVQLTRRNHSLALTWAGRLDDAERLMAGVLRQGARLARDGYDANAWMAGIRERLAGRPAAALALQQQALASLPADARDGTPRARILTEQGLAQLALGNPAAARTALDEALRLFEARGVDLVAEHADALLGLGRLLLAEGAPGALAPIERAEAFWRALDADSRWAGEAAHWRARALAAEGRAAEAQPLRERARAILARSPFPVDRTLPAASSR